MKPPLVTSFYTRDGRYPELAERLSKSCAQLGIESVIREIPSTNWMENTNHKPKFILDALMSRRGPVWWLDADCYLCPNVTKTFDKIATSGYDFAIYNWRADPTNVKAIQVDPTKLLGSSGVVYFNYSAPAMELLLRWQDEICRTPTLVDDQSLDVVFNDPDRRPPVKACWLGKTMNWMTGLFGPVPEVASIGHEFVERAHYHATA